MTPFFAIVRLISVLTMAMFLDVGAIQQSRDASAHPAGGSASLSGVVTTDEDTMKPLTRAAITVRGSTVGDDRVALTDEQGRFEFQGLPPGPVEVSSRKNGYVTTSYGATSVGGPGTPVHLVSGRSIHVAIRMVRAAVITGTIRDPVGAPLRGMLVFALDATNPNAVVLPQRLDWQTPPSAMTDDRGTYRISSLRPGTYIIVAFSQKGVGTPGIELLSPVDIDQRLAELRAAQSPARATIPRGTTGAMVSPTDRVVAPIFFPGTARRTEAVPIQVAPGDERGALDFAFASVGVRTIRGVVTPFDPNVELTITALDSVGGLALAAGNPRLAEKPNTDGHFLYTNLGVLNRSAQHDGGSGHGATDGTGARRHLDTTPAR